MHMYYVIVVAPKHSGVEIKGTAIRATNTFYANEEAYKFVDECGYSRRDVTVTVSPISDTFVLDTARSILGITN